jgi:hypothetical protein
VGEGSIIAYGIDGRTYYNAVAEAARRPEGFLVIVPDLANRGAQGLRQAEPHPSPVKHVMRLGGGGVLVGHALSMLTGKLTTAPKIGRVFKRQSLTEAGLGFTRKGGEAA